MISTKIGSHAHNLKQAVIAYLTVDTGALIPCLLLGPKEGDVDEDEDSGGVGVAGRQKVRADAGDEAGRRWARTPATRTAGGGELDAADPALRWRDAAASTVVWRGVRDGVAVRRGVRVRAAWSAGAAAWSGGAAGWRRGKDPRGFLGWAHLSSRVAMAGC